MDENCDHQLNILVLAINQKAFSVLINGNRIGQKKKVLTETD